MNRSDAVRKFEEILRETLGLQRLTITDQTVAADIDGWDSLSHLSIMLQAEMQFGITIPIEKTYEMRTVGELVTLMQALNRE